MQAREHHCMQAADDAGLTCYGLEQHGWTNSHTQIHVPTQLCSCFDSAHCGQWTNESLCLSAVLVQHSQLEVKYHSRAVGTEVSMSLPTCTCTSLLPSSGIHQDHDQHEQVEARRWSRVLPRRTFKSLGPNLACPSASSPLRNAMWHVTLRDRSGPNAPAPPQLQSGSQQAAVKRLLSDDLLSWADIWPGRVKGTRRPRNANDMCCITYASNCIDVT